MADRKPLTIHYRRFTRDAQHGPNSLEALIKSAMNTINGAGPIKGDYSKRILASGDDSFFMNIFHETTADGRPVVFGDVLHYTQGHLQALIQQAPAAAPSVPVTQLPADAGREYVHSQMFWMVKGDHVFIVQSQSLKNEALENYLKWLLTVKTSVLNANCNVVLQSKFDTGDLGGDLGDIKELIIGGVASPIAPEINAPAAAAAAAAAAAGPAAIVAAPPSYIDVNHQGSVNARQVSSKDRILEVLRVLLAGQEKVDEVYAALPADAELSVHVHIGFVTKKRTVDRTSLKHLETGLRNIPDSQLQVRSKNGVIGKDGHVRLHDTAQVLLLKLTMNQAEVIGSLIDPTDMLRAFVGTYDRFLANGKIAA